MNHEPELRTSSSLAHRNPMSAAADLLRGPISDLAHRPPNNVATLDVLRSLAILLVFTGHFAPGYQAAAWFSRSPAAYFGWTGVDLFYVLSGLLIGIQLWKELKKTNYIKIPVFLLRRGLRIWPLYYTFAAFILLEGIFFHRNLSGIWSDLLFLSNYFHNQIGGGWSLSTEEQFYILIPISLLLVSRIIPLRRMWVFPAVVLVCMPVVRALTVRAYGAAIAHQRMYFPIHTHSDGLAIGILLAWTAVMHPEFVKTGSARKFVIPMAALLGAALYAWDRIVFNYTSLALVYGAMALWGLAIRQPGRILSWHGFYIISRLSYGMYLNQFGLLRITDWLRPLHRFGVAGLLFAYLLALGACMLVAFCTFMLIERPFLNLRDRWLASRAKVKPAETMEKLAV